MKDEIHRLNFKQILKTIVSLLAPRMLKTSPMAPGMNAKESMSQRSARNCRHFSSAAHPQISLTFLEMPLGLWEHQNSEAMSSYPYMLKALAYFLGSRYPLRTPSVAGLNYRNSGWVWWRVQNHSKDCSQIVLVRSQYPQEGILTWDAWPDTWSHSPLIGWEIPPFHTS